MVHNQKSKNAEDKRGQDQSVDAVQAEFDEYIKELDKELKEAEKGLKEGKPLPLIPIDEYIEKFKNSDKGAFEK